MPEVKRESTFENNWEYTHAARRLQAKGILRTERSASGKTRLPTSCFHFDRGAWLGIIACGLSAADGDVCAVWSGSSVCAQCMRQALQ